MARRQICDRKKIISRFNRSQLYYLSPLIKDTTKDTIRSTHSAKNVRRFKRKVSFKVQPKSPSKMDVSILVRSQQNDPLSTNPPERRDQDEVCDENSPLTFGELIEYTILNLSNQMQLQIHRHVEILKKFPEYKEPIETHSDMLEICRRVQIKLNDTLGSSEYDDLLRYQDVIEGFLNDTFKSLT